MKNLVYQNRYLIVGIFGIILLFGIFSWPSTTKKSFQKNASKREKTWQTVEVETASEFSSIKLPAKAKSNKFAVISPRRGGIIQDLLVDVGDEVTRGQTIGSMLPEGVEGQSSAAINEASSRLGKARAELAQAKGVATDSVSVATKQWRETQTQYDTQNTLDTETQKQLKEKKLEASLIATQAWEQVKIILFGNGSNISSRKILGSFSNSTQKNKVENLADEIDRMETSGLWGTPEKVREHLNHLENFLTQTENLYKSAREGNSISASTVTSNLNTIQNQQLKVAQTKQAILTLEEKLQRFVSQKNEKEASIERASEMLDLVQSQQNLSITQAEKNVEVALANYNAALVKAGHQTITSPFSGKITARMVEVGQAVNLSTPLFYLEGVATALSQEAVSEVHFQLPESWNGKIKTGDAVTIKSLEGELFTGKVFRLSDQIHLKNNSISATAVVFEITYEEVENLEESANEESQVEKRKVITPVNFPHGKSLFVYLRSSDSSIFSVPTLSLKKRSNQYFLWKMEDKMPIQIPVEIMAEDGELSQVFSKIISDGDLIINNPSSSLFKK